MALAVTSTVGYLAVDRYMPVVRDDDGVLSVPFVSWKAVRARPCLWRPHHMKVSGPVDGGALVYLELPSKICHHKSLGWS
jgi:hypothetical protein